MTDLTEALNSALASALPLLLISAVAVVIYLALLSATFTKSKMLALLHQEVRSQVERNEKSILEGKPAPYLDSWKGLEQALRAHLKREGILRKPGP